MTQIYWFLATWRRRAYAG